MLASLADTLKTLNRSWTTSRTTSRKQFADQKLLIDNLGGECASCASASTRTTLLSVSQDLNRCARPRVTSCVPRSAAARGTARRAGPDAGGRAPPAPAGRRRGAGADGHLAPAGRRRGLSPQRMFDTAQADYAAGQWPLAIWASSSSSALPDQRRQTTAVLHRRVVSAGWEVQGGHRGLREGEHRIPLGRSCPEAMYKRGIALVCSARTTSAPGKRCNRCSATTAKRGRGARQAGPRWVEAQAGE